MKSFAKRYQSFGGLPALTRFCLFIDCNPCRVYMPPNAAPEWQAGSLRWRSRLHLGACPLEGLVRRSPYGRIHTQLTEIVLRPVKAPQGKTTRGAKHQVYCCMKMDLSWRTLFHVPLTVADHFIHSLSTRGFHPRSNLRISLCRFTPIIRFILV